LFPPPLPPPVWCGKIRESDSGLPYSHFRGEREGEGGAGWETGTRHGKVAKIKIPFFITNLNESVITSRVSSLNRLKRNGGFIIAGMGPTGQDLCCSGWNLASMSKPYGWNGH
jgi:hypothetical protein